MGEFGSLQQVMIPGVSPHGVEGTAGHLENSIDRLQLVMGLVNAVKRLPHGKVLASCL